jgi:hypothetical protein
LEEQLTLLLHDILNDPNGDAVLFEFRQLCHAAATPEGRMVECAAHMQRAQVIRRGLRQVQHSHFAGIPPVAKTTQRRPGPGL